MPDENPDTCKLSAVADAQAVHADNGQLISSKPAAFVLVASAYLLGGGGMLIYLIFLLFGPPHLLDFKLSTAGRLLVDASLCLLFFVQHSLMVRQWFRTRLTRLVRADFQGALFATVSGLCLLLMVGFWQPVSILWFAPAPLRWIMAIFFLAALGVGWWGVRSLKKFDGLGVEPVLKAFNPKRPPEATVFTIRGPYRWVRHPLYLVSLIMIWTGPVFTADRLLHNLLMTIWIFIGATWEERDLVACFGSAYRRYQQAVPMLLPTSVMPLIKDDGNNLRN
jgi:protein-S-isoprenylcysteine O-methyltransferase Ste14